MASHAGHVEVARLLVDGGAGVNEVDILGATPLNKKLSDWITQISSASSTDESIRICISL